MSVPDPIRQLDAILKPKSVAVIGASTSPDKIGYEILKNILDSGFKGSVYPINPKADVILDLPCHKTVKDIAEPPDLAVVIIPARFVPQAIQECGEASVKGAVIITGGFSEAGQEGEALQNQVVEIAQKFGVRIIGPNCQGVNNPHHPLCASWPLLTYKGKIALISQSGTVGAAMMDWLSEDKLGTSSFVSMGNRADVDETDLIAYFNQDPNTDVIAAYIEGIKRPDQFIKSVEQLQKPLVVLKSGRTPKGKVAAESHTKALAGADAIYEALFSKYNICRAYTAEEFYDYAKALAYLKPPKGNRILFVTTSGGAAILATDQAEQEGLDVSPLPEEAVEAITPLIPANAIKARINLVGWMDIRKARKTRGKRKLPKRPPKRDKLQRALLLLQNGVGTGRIGDEIRTVEEFDRHKRRAPSLPLHLCHGLQLFSRGGFEVVDLDLHRDRGEPFVQI